MPVTLEPDVDDRTAERPIDDLLTRIERGDVFDLTAHEVRSSIIELERHRARVDAVQNRLIDRFDQDVLATGDGYRTTRAWLTQRTQMAGATASRRVKVARALRTLPHVTSAFESGAFSFEQASAFAVAVNPRTEAAMENDEADLVHLAGGLRVDDLQRELHHWKESVDQDGPEPDAGHRARNLTMSQGLDGQWFGSIELGAADGAVVTSAVEQMAEFLYHHETAGSDGDPALTRTPGQRRADALVELVRRGLATLSDEFSPTRAPKPSITLLVTLEDAAAGRSASTDRGDIVTPAGLERLACDCSVDPVGWSVDGVPLSHGRTKRFPTAAQRRATHAQHGGCAWPGCDAPQAWAHVHHLQHWMRDRGATDQENLAPFCAATHHRLLHEGGWNARREADGTITILRPDGTTFDPSPGWPVRPSH